MSISDTTTTWIPQFLRSSSTSKTTPEEASALLPKPLDDSTDSFTSSSTLTEFLLLLKMSIPVILAYTLQNSLQTVSVLIVGRMSPEHLATAAFSYMFAMSTAWLIALGGSTALDTLCSSTFTGSRNPHELGILLQRAFIVLGLFYVPVATTWWFSEGLFLRLGQSAELAQQSALFLRWLIPGGLGYIYFESMKKFLQAQGVMVAGTYVLLITSPVNAILNYLFVYTWEWGLIGAPVATGVTYWASFAAIMAYARFVKGWESWGGWDRSCLKNMGVFAKLAGLGVVMVGTEWWAFEIVALVAGRLGTIPLASQSVIMTTDQVLNTIPFGIGVAASTRVGNLLGARDAHGASRAANTAAMLSIVAGTVVMITMLAVKDVYAKIFSDDADVIKLTAEVMPLVALFQIADGLVGSCGGSLRGMGRQHVGAAVNLGCYYLGALPLGIWLAFNGWGLQGLWVGQCLALYLVGAAEWVLVKWSDWEKQVRMAFERMEVEEQIEQGGI